MKKMISIVALCFSASFIMEGCMSSSRTHNLPDQDEYQGYKIIDGINKDTVYINVNNDEKIAVVIRDIATTSYNYLEPRYTNSMVNYEGKGSCCAPTSLLMGGSGNVVYKFSFIGKGKTTIKIIARHKGESITTNTLDDDKTFSINVNVD